MNDSATDPVERTAYITCGVCEASCGLEVKLRDEQIESIRGHEGDRRAAATSARKPLRCRTSMLILIGCVSRCGAPATTGSRWSGTRRSAWSPPGSRRSRPGTRSQWCRCLTGNPNVHLLGALTHGINLSAPWARRTPSAPRRSTSCRTNSWRGPLPATSSSCRCPTSTAPDLLRALRPQPDGQQRLDLDGSGLPAWRRELASRGGRFVVGIRVARRRLRLPTSITSSDRHRRLGAPGDVAGGAGVGRQPRGIRRRGGGGAASGRALHPEVAESFLRYAGRHDPGVGGDLHGARAAALHGRMGCRPRPWRGVPVGDSCINILTGNLTDPAGPMLTSPAIDLVGHKIVAAGHFGAAVAGKGVAGVRIRVSCVDTRPTRS